MDRAAPRSDKAFERAPPALPSELDFLARQGISPEELLNAIGAAPRGVRPVDSLLGEGIVREEGYYRALAQHLGCEYYSGEPPFAADFDAIRGLRCGVAPLTWRGQGARAVIAPRAQSVSPLIEMAQSGRIRSTSFAVTSPQRFASLVRLHRGDAILDHALGRLPGELSAKGGLTGRQIGAAAALAAGGCAIAAASFNALQALASAGLWATFTAAIVARSMAAVANDATIRPALLSDDELPVYTVVAAVYREADVVEHLIKAFDAFDYPKSKLDIKIVVERRDLETLSRIVELRLPARYEVIVAPPGEPSTKPRALNIALSCARGDLLAVYDAEDAPSPDQLRIAASRFAAEANIDCLQARLKIRNDGDSWLSKLFSLEYAALFDLINPGLCALGLPVALGGTSNHFRVRSLESVGGWDEWNVAEDADLGIRLARLGYRVGSIDSDTSEEAPHEFANWFRQRVRWQKGWMQTCIVHSRQPIRFVQRSGSGAGRGRGDAGRRRGHQRPVLAGVRDRHHLARVVGRRRVSVAMARGGRRFHLHPRPFRGVDDGASRARRRQTAALDRDAEDARSDAGLLSPGVGRRLDRDFRPGGAAPLLGENRARPHAAAPRGEGRPRRQSGVGRSAPDARDKSIPAERPFAHSCRARPLGTPSDF